MRSSDIQCLDRRGALRLAAASMALTWQHAMAQTFIQDTPSSSTGLQRTENGEPNLQLKLSEPIPRQISTIETPDWRQILLSGDRVIRLARDGGKMHEIRYCRSNGEMDRDGYGLACWLLRDVRAGKLFPIDPILLDVLFGLQQWARVNGKELALRATSGFRTDATNSSIEGAAHRSLHRLGKAVDAVPEGIAFDVLGAMVRLFNNKGGTGIYFYRSFVHIDTGPYRTWYR